MPIRRGSEACPQFSSPSHESADFPRMLRSGHLIALCVLALLSLGVLMVNSAGMSVDPREAVTVESILLSRSSAYMLGALIAMGACAMLPIRRLVPARLRAADPAIPLDLDLPPARRGFNGWLSLVGGAWVRLAPMWALIAALLAFLALVYVPGIGKEVNGSHRWLRLPVPGLESFQPSEIAKWGLIGVLALYGARFAGRMHKFWVGLLPALAAAGAVAAFIVKEDLGTGVLVGLVAALMLIAAGAKVWHLAILAPLPILGVVVAIATSPYRRERLLAFLDPYQHPQTIGYHMIQSMVAVANGQVSGRGLGHGLQKFGFLPEDKTDFLFAIICEELGVAGCMVVLALFGALIWTSLSVVRHERWRVLQLAGLGIIITVGVQAVINLFVVTGLGPTKGIALPLLSSGGTGWVLTAASLGLLIAMDRTQHQARAMEVPRTDLIERARREREKLDAQRAARHGERTRRAHERAESADARVSNTPDQPSLAAATTASAALSEANADTSAPSASEAGTHAHGPLDDRHLGDLRFAPKNLAQNPLLDGGGREWTESETHHTAEIVDAPLPAAFDTARAVDDVNTVNAVEVDPDSHAAPQFEVDDAPITLARRGTYIPPESWTNSDANQGTETSADREHASFTDARPALQPIEATHAETDARKDWSPALGGPSVASPSIMETRPTVAHAGSVAAVSKVTMLSSPGEQGWLFSVSSTPISQSKVTMLTTGAREATGAAAKSRVVVTDLGKSYHGATSSEPPTPSRDMPSTSSDLPRA